MDRPIDSLTGLVSGVELNAEMENLMAGSSEFAYAKVDVDMLFNANRDFGHEAGDAIFKCVAKHLKEIFPQPCAVFRDSRDEFDILLPGSTKEEAFLKAEQARKLINSEKLNYKSKDGRPMTQSVSIGISSYPYDGDRPADIIRRADSAVARAKKNGRNQVCLAREEKLIPKTSHYTSAQLEKLTLIAEKEKIGEAVLLREALDDLLKKYDE
ncbi:MAG: diguanylate cyclase [Treponema sp.]|nr:diguanylate cyclase [Treponema sp.]